MSLTLEQIAALYSIFTKLLALFLIFIITPSILVQFNERRLLGIKFSMFTMAAVTAACILPVLYYQVLNFLSVPNDHLVAFVTIANSTSLLTTAGAMYVIYKGGRN